VRGNDPRHHHRAHPIALGLARVASSDSNPKRCIARRTACTWPCGKDLTISNHCCAGCRLTPRAPHGSTRSAHRERGQIGERALVHLLALAVRLAQQVGRARGAVRDGIDVHGHIMQQQKHQINTYPSIYMGTLCTRKYHSRRQIIRIKQGFADYRMQSAEGNFRLDIYDWKDLGSSTAAIPARG